VIGAVLNHQVNGVAGTYLRAELDKAKGVALDRWACQLEELIERTAA
jgi:hypothetical protein